MESIRTHKKDSIDGIVSFLNSSPLDPDAEVIIAVPAVYLDYVQGRLPKGVSVAAQVLLAIMNPNNSIP